MIAHIVFVNGDQEMFPIVSFYYKQDTKTMKLGAEQKGENVTMALASDATVYILNDNGDAYCTFDTIGVPRPVEEKKDERDTDQV